MFDFLQMILTDKMFQKIENYPVYCWNNGEKEHVKFQRGKYMSFQVHNFITKINYPSNSKRSYGLSVYIHFIEYRVKQLIQKEKIQINSLNDYKKVYERVLRENKLETECARFYKNYLRRQEFKDARERGIYGNS